ncbi:MAG: 23S rRNA (pseudouridine(1915)-N(3))-methyltransferase RlmH [Bacteroidota bacterium]
MKINLIVVGKTEYQYLQTGVDIYKKRIKHYIPFEITTIPGLKNTKSLSPDQILKKEAELLLKNMKNIDYCILLDEKGKAMRSLDFARFIELKMQQSIKNLTFIIGGAHGFAQEIYDIADMKLSLSEMTFSHQMIRLFFTEQLYRAFSIIKNEPYHNE